MDEFVQTYYVDMKCPVRKIRDKIREKTGKELSTKDIINKKAVLLGVKSEIEEVKEAFEKYIETDPGTGEAKVAQV